MRTSRSWEKLSGARPIPEDIPFAACPSDASGGGPNRSALARRLLMLLRVCGCAIRGPGQRVKSPRGQVLRQMGGAGQA